MDYQYQAFLPHEKWKDWFEPSCRQGTKKVVCYKPSLNAVWI